MLMAFSDESGFSVLQSSEERRRAEPSRITIPVILANNIFPGRTCLHMYMYAVFFLHICNMHMYII